MEARNELKYILANTNDLLKFGEAKHAGLILLNSGLIVGIITAYSSIHELVYKPMILTGGIFFGLALLLSIISQFPVISNTLYTKKEITDPNIYFFAHLACLDRAEFITAYTQMDPAFAPTKFHTNLIDQILVVSRITRSKFTFFAVASYCTAFGFSIIGISIVIKAIWHF